MKKYILAVLLTFLFFFIKIDFANAIEENLIDTNYLERTKIKELHAQGFKGDGVKIAIMDSGSITHNEFKLANRLSFLGKGDLISTQEDDVTDNYGHGTAVASLIGGSGRIEGVAPNSSIYSLKVGNDNSIDSKALEKAITWCIDNDIDIINMSFSYSDNWFTDFIVGGAYEALFEELYQNEIFVVAAAGNNGDEINYQKDTVSYPAKFPHVIAVSNTNNEDQIEVTSSKGPDVKISAPGTNLLTANIGGPNEYKYRTGTSMSAPIVSGTLALLKQKYPEASYRELNLLLFYLAQTGYQSGGSTSNESLDNELALKRNNYYGFGLLKGEIGEDTPGTIKITDEYNETITSLCTFPKDNIFCTSNRLEVGRDYKVFRTFNDRENNLWLEVENTINNKKQLGWVRFRTKDYSHKITLNTSNKIFNNISDTTDVGSLNPQTVNAIRKTIGGDWFLINTWKGEKWVNLKDYIVGDFKLTSVNRESLYIKQSDGSYLLSGGTITPQTVTSTFRQGDWYRINTWEGERWIKPKSYFIGDFILTTPSEVKVYTEKGDLDSYVGNFNMGSHKIVRRDNDWFLRDDGYWIKPSKYYLGVFQIKLLESKKIYRLTKYNSFEQVGSLSPQTVYAYGGESIRYSSSSPYFPTYTINSWLGKVLIVGDEPGVQTIKGIELMECDDNLLK